MTVILKVKSLHFRSYCGAFDSSSDSGGNHDARRENTPAPLERTHGRKGLWDSVFVLFVVIHVFFIAKKSDRKKNYKSQQLRRRSCPRC